MMFLVKLVPDLLLALKHFLVSEEYNLYVCAFVGICKYVCMCMRYFACTHAEMHTKGSECILCFIVLECVFSVRLFVIDAIAFITCDIYITDMW